MSEQTSPLHGEPVAAGRRLPYSFRIRTDALTSDTAAVLTVAILAVTLVFGAFLRFSHNNWDQAGDDGQGAHSAHLHPDERFLTQISNDTKGASSPFNYFDTDNSALNPYNIN